MSKNSNTDKSKRSIRVGPRGDGFIYRQPKSPYWWCSYNLPGRRERIRQSTEKKDEKQAIKFLRDKLKEVHADEIGARKFVGPSAEKLTVNDALYSLEANYKIREKFSPQVKSRFKAIKASIGLVRLKTLSEDDIDRWIAKLKVTCNRLSRMPEEQSQVHECDEHCKKLSPSTINKYSQILGQALRRMADKIGNPPRITKLEENNVRQGFFEYGEFLDVLQYLPEDLRDYTHFDFLCGWRKGEVSNLQWTMIDYEGRTLRLPAHFSKNRRPKKVPLQGELWEIIQRRRKERSIQMPDGSVFLCPYVFFRRKGRGLPWAWRKIGEFRKTWKRACKFAGLPDKIFHDFRRTAARNLVRAGVSEKVAMMITGHLSTSMFQRYNITSDDDLIDAIEKEAKYIAALAEKDAKKREENAKFGEQKDGGTV